MAISKQFSKTLDDLWRRRTAKLRSLVIPRGVGQPPKFSRQGRETIINRLLDTATTILVRRDARLEFSKIYEERRLKYIKGRGLLNRGRELVRWAQEGLNGPIIYVFWHRNKCLYVGKAISWKRLRQYERSAYMLQATCIEVFCITHKSQLGKAECLATHLFEPRDKKVKPARVRWGKACQICRKHDAVRAQLRGLFRMK